MTKAAATRTDVINDCIRAVELEEELSGPMPDAMHNLPAEDLLRAVVRATKRSIIERMQNMKRG